jgi:hypothetical protein
MLFDKEFEFKGKHATYCRFLKDEIKLFKTFREVYTVSAIIGFLNTSKSKKDDEKVQPASVLPSELAQKRPALTYIYRLMMLLDNADGYSIKDYQDRTFRDDADADAHPEKLAANMETFNAYALGGIEILYDVFKDCKTKKDTVNTLNDYLLDFYADNGLLDY